MIKKRGQFQLSFGMIFAIIMIIAFAFVAFVAIKHFLGLKDCALVGNFYENLGQEIEKVWKSQSSDQEFSALLPSGIEYVCFGDMTKSEKGAPAGVYKALSKNIVARHNVFLYPTGNACGLESREVLHLDIGNITKGMNPYCVKSDGKVSFRIEKGFYDSLVKIK